MHLQIAPFLLRRRRDCLLHCTGCPAVYAEACTVAADVAADAAAATAAAGNNITVEWT